MSLCHALRLLWPPLQLAKAHPDASLWGSSSASVFVMGLQVLFLASVATSVLFGYFGNSRALE